MNVCEFDGCGRPAATLLTQAHTGFEAGFCVGITQALCQVHARRRETQITAAVLSLAHEGTVHCADQAALKATGLSGTLHHQNPYRSRP
ncbi:hypothetical protein [Micrococcus lylae]|uniref:Uncharacterized protein n=1 Tax=Micrococcus lylae TaxID=1273 RepID=A0ABY2JWL4_9MICC|nr:hypothetical protein [Micrococcus lylae]TFH97830.1 hypothetical protein E4A49_11710 [Micrococcus lylae]